MSTRVFAIDDFDGAAMGIHEFEHHREPDARALDLHAGGRPSGVEGFEHACTLFRRDAGAGVGDVDHELGVLFGGM